MQLEDGLRVLFCNAATSLGARTVRFFIVPTKDSVTPSLPNRSAVPSLVLLR
jgi:hypothetical protein